MTAELTGTRPEPDMRPAAPPEAGRKGPLIYRQSVFTRVTHWLWAVALFFLLLTGLNIFNARPQLYVGQQSGFGFDNTILEIGHERVNGEWRGYLDLFGHKIDTTGVLGISGPPERLSGTAFPGWATIPSYYDLATARVIHFFFAWVLVVTLAVWWAASIANRHVAEVPPTRQDFRRLPGTILDHLRLRFEHGRRYNGLQKIAYSLVLFVLFPLIVLTGLTMSPGLNTALPWLVDLFGGRQTARTIHFFVMVCLVLFFVVHIVMVVLAGPINEMRQMITGRYRAGRDVAFDPGKGDRP